MVDGEPLEGILGAEIDGHLVPPAAIERVSHQEDQRAPSLLTSALPLLKTSRQVLLEPGGVRSFRRLHLVLVQHVLSALEMPGDVGVHDLGSNAVLGMLGYVRVELQQGAFEGNQRVAPDPSKSVSDWEGAQGSEEDGVQRHGRDEGEIGALVFPEDFLHALPHGLSYPLLDQLGRVCVGETVRVPEVRSCCGDEVDRFQPADSPCMLLSLPHRQLP
mmetsp:Transcript_31738/g.101318  ORF Transcript_31738/g.101318 Transcript_31738/m.101318 type:complete len:217 (+) Transcript_31738:218-868(+)